MKQEKKLYFYANKIDFLKSKALKEIQMTNSLKNPKRKQ